MFHGFGCLKSDHKAKCTLSGRKYHLGCLKSDSCVIDNRTIQSGVAIGKSKQLDTVRIAVKEILNILFLGLKRIPRQMIRNKQ